MIARLLNAWRALCGAEVYSPAASRFIETGRRYVSAKIGHERVSRWEQRLIEDGKALIRERSQEVRS